MSRYLNDEEYSAARQALVDAGYSESGADTELEKHQEKFRSTTDSLIKHFNESSAQRLALEGIGAALATYGAVEAGKGIYNRMFKKPETPTQFVEPSLDSGKPLANPVGSEPVLFEDGKFSIEKIPTAEQATQQQVEQGKIKTGKAGGSISPEGATLIANEEKGMNVSQTKRLEDYSKLMAETEGKLGPATTTTGTGLAAYVGEGGEKAKIRKNYASIKDVPPDLVWIPGGNNLGLVRNAVGPEAYLENLKKTGGFPLSNQDAIAQSREINRSLGRMTREEAKAAGAPLGQAAKSITKEVSGSKLVKVAGVGGALISLADLALAGQKAKEGEYGEAAKIGIPAAAGLVNPAAGGLTGAAAEPGIAASQLRAVAPVMGMFADISQQKISKYLKDKEQAQKVGAGRGIAPPSDYMR